MLYGRSMAKIVILGAHTALGEALTAALEDRAIEAKTQRAAPLEHIGPGLHPIDENVLDDAGLVFLAMDGPWAEAFAAGADRLAVPVVDLAGASPDGLRLFPVLEPGLGGLLPQRGLVRVPAALPSAVVAVLRALAPFGPAGVRVVAMEGAAERDQPGMDELAAQTRAVFIGRDAPAEVFPGPVAFGVASTVGAEDDPFGPDARFAADIEAGSGVRVRAARVRVPVFTGEAAVLELELSDPPGAETVRDVLAAARGLRLSRIPAPSSLDAVDRDDVLVGRIRMEGPRLDAFVAVDRIRASAAAGALIAEAWVSSAPAS